LCGHVKKKKKKTANFDCSAAGFSLKAIYSSHVAMVAILLRSEDFGHYCCNRNLSMGMKLNMAKMLKCAGDKDMVTIKADDGGDNITFMFESPSTNPLSFLLFCILFCLVAEKMKGKCAN
jgi:proliferating cell nuclear antigen